MKVTVDNDKCVKFTNCNECRAEMHCGWCTSEDQPIGSCKSTTKNSDTCKHWVENCWVLPLAVHNFNPMCEAFTQCNECLESDIGCKYCPDENKCLPVDSAIRCSVPFITIETEDECPMTKKDAGSALTPFACVIVLFSFLICLL